MPDHDGVNVRFLFEIDLDPLFPGPSSTQEPSSPSLSPSVIKSKVPTTGSVSLAVTFLPFARFTVPAGTMKSDCWSFIRRFEVRNINRHGGADKERLGQIGFQRHFGSSAIG